MIRKLVEKDRNEVLEFLAEEAAINLFIIGDIEVFGFNKEFQELWGQYEGENLEGVLLRFNENYIPYWKKDGFDASGFKEIIKKHKGKVMMNGKKSIIDTLDDLLPTFRRKNTFFCEMTKLNKERDYNNRVKIAKVEDSQRIKDMLDSIDEFTNMQNEVDRIEHKIETQTGRIYYLEDSNGEIVSIAQTTAENSKSAMIVGVATKKEHRGKGLVKECLYRLCRDVLREGRSLCLFYDNPAAGKIYLDFGFETIDDWVMVVE